MAATLKDSTNKSVETKTQGSKVMGFERGLEPEKILAITEYQGEIHFVIKWKGSDISDVVPRLEANHKCPQVVIAFYQERISWMTNRTLAQILGEEDDFTEGSQMI